MNKSKEIRPNYFYGLKLSVIVVLFTSFSGFAQPYKQFVDFADQQMEIGDYYYAIEYYQKAMQYDSNSVEILWKYAEAQRKYKNYGLAEFYYTKVYGKEEARIYPMSIFYLAEMQYINGNYKASLESWKLVKKRFKRDRDSYQYVKSQKMITNCLWVERAKVDTNEHIVYALTNPVNTENTEFAPVLFNDHLYFSSLKADSINFLEEVYASEYSVQIYRADKIDTLFDHVDLLKDVVQGGMNSANGSFSPDGKRFYFSRCDQSYGCQIYVGRVKENKIVDIEPLGDIINEPGKISTMPHCTVINGQEVLFFASNIDHNYGGYDIWYSLIENGNKYSLPKSLGPTINSPDDEICPFYDTVENKLYFSSTWHPGFGGMDIFYTEFSNYEFSEPVNLGLPINSNRNDTYFIKDQKSNRFYFSSNREGVLYAKNPTCCNDIFAAYIPVIPPPTPWESLEELNKHLPVTLYFHNDRPDPKTKDTTTTLNYLTTYNRYLRMIPKYKSEYSSGLKGDKAVEAEEDIDDFFTEFVKQGVLDLDLFTSLLIKELEKGYEIEVTVQGFASPLAPTAYNVNLTKRRISSLMNYLREYEGGIFIPYIDGTAENGGRLTFVTIPFGEYTADKLISDNPNDQKESIYNRKAGLERKIEIQSVSLVTKDSIYAEMKFNREVHDFGATNKGDLLKYEFSFTNTGDDTLRIDKVEYDCPCINANISSTTFFPGQSGKLSVTYDTKNETGITYKHIYIFSNIKRGKKEITLTTEVH